MEPTFFAKWSRHFRNLCIVQKDDKFEVATATTEEEIRKLGVAGFQKYDERKIGETCISYYGRPERFSV